MTTLTFPTLVQAPAMFDFGLVSNTVTFSSPLSQAIQTVEMPSPRWQFKFSLDRLEEADAALVQGFIAQLRGQAGRFYMHNMARSTPRGIATGTPVVAGASQTGTTLNTSGWTPSQIGILKVGDFFKIGNELKMVVSADVNSDGAGLATITFEPPIRSSPSNGSSIVTNKPTAIFKLAGDNSSWSTVAPVWTTINIDGIEVL